MKNTVWLVFETFPAGRVIEVFRDKCDADASAAKIVLDYAAKGHFRGQYGEIKAAHDERRFEDVLRLMRNHVSDCGWDGYNIEVMEETVH